MDVRAHSRRTVHREHSVQTAESRREGGRHNKEDLSPPVAPLFRHTPYRTRHRLEDCQGAYGA